MSFDPGSLAKLAPPLLGVIFFLTCLSQIRRGVLRVPNWVLSLIVLVILIFFYPAPW